MNINDRGTVCDTFWKFSYEDEGRKADLTLHIYKKPKTKGKQSKILIQGGFQLLTCLYVFNEMPKIYKKLREVKSREIQNVTPQPKNISRNTVKCDQCKFKATLIQMKMHLKNVHGPKLRRASKR